MQKIVIDTNILLETPEILQERKAQYIIPYTVLKELDDLKRKRYELGYAVRLAARIILAEKENIIFTEGTQEDYSINDEKIIATAKRYEAQLYTEDILMTLLAETNDIKVSNPVQEEINTNYNGYYELQVTEDMEDLIQTYFSRTPTTTKGFDPDLIKKYLGKNTTSNEYVILHYDSSYMIFKYNEENNYYEKQNFKAKKVKINGSGPVVEPLDVYQHVALTSACDLNVPMTIIDGPVGSGKSLLGLTAALHLVYANNDISDIYITRPPIGIDSRYDIGYLPGSKDEKLAPWIGGVMSNLEFLYPRGAEQIFRETFKHFAVNTAQGYSIHKSVLIVDESQLLSIDVMKQIMSRVAEGSKLILLGDEAQTYKVVPKAEMGFRKLKNLLPLSSIEYIKLQKIYRGKLAELSIKL